MSVTVDQKISVGSHVPGTVRAGVELVGDRSVVVARSVSKHHAGALTRADGAKIARAAKTAYDQRRPLVLILSSSGAEVEEGIDSLQGWGEAAAQVSRCSGTVPVLAAVTGPVLSGPALLLGLVDVTVMTSEAYSFLSGPDAVLAFTGVTIDRRELGGTNRHLSYSGLCALVASDESHATELIAAALSYLPDHTDSRPPEVVTDDAIDRADPGLGSLVPSSPTASYDVRDLLRGVVDDAEILELRERWAPQLVTALAGIGGCAVGIVANQPRSLAGTLDISASQKAARFVRFCDSFNLPIVTFVDCPGFLPGKDLEWRGMIRHGAELAFAYAEATVPRVSVVVRKAYGGAYIVMDSKGIGNDICFAWPSAEIAVMGARGAAQILGRGATTEERTELEEDYAQEFMTPWTAAERRYVDEVIDPAATRPAVARALQVLSTRRETLPGRKHDAGPI